MVKKPKQRDRKRERKTKLAKANKHTRWAPIWVMPKKFGQGKRIHPSAITRHRRSWRQTKLHVKPRKEDKRYLG
ncbi:MAG: hypothetical protein ABEI74_01465 [Candidatus Pacearchaeota archaeon]